MTSPEADSANDNPVPCIPTYWASKEALLQANEYGNIEHLTETEAPDGLDLGKIVKHWQDGQTLGLHWTLGGKIRPSHFVGAVWLEQDKKQYPLVVKPKIAQVDVLQMFCSVASHPAIMGSLKSFFKCWPDQDLIDGIPLENLSLLQVAIYLNRLVKFCRRHLRQGFIRVADNCPGNIKGKILPEANLRANTVHGRADRVYCQYQIVSSDTLANQILKFALFLSIKCLGKYSKGNDELQIFWNWARQCEAALASVSLRAITQNDFQGLFYSGLMQRYKEPHKLAKMIIKQFKVEASGEFKEPELKTVPFYLDMNNLFEKYVGAKLREAELEVRYQDRNTIRDGFELTYCPDFIVAEPLMVIDAKYKLMFERETDEDKEAEKIFFKDLFIYKSDIYQILAYSMLLAAEKPSDRFPQRAILVYPDTKIKMDWRTYFKENKSIPIPEIKLELPTKKTLILSLLPRELPISGNKNA
ncbi:MAG: hypothetical protein DRN14_05025 [Thermoplasmata archaeon]|nr:MAG: hypothetical protein DRN14_05025 [Thermoplasmata archaeon]